MSRRLLVRAVVAIALAVAASTVGIWQAQTTLAETYPIPATGTIAVQGHGNGHGHGMSQYGALGAAMAGLTERQIVAFYYPSTSLVALTNPATIRVLLSNAGSSTVVSAATGLTLTGYGTLPAGYSRFRVTAPSGVTTLHLDGLSGTTWKPLKDGLPSGGEFSRPANNVQVWFTDHTSTVYRGNVRVVRGGSGVLTINRAGLDQYTEGVVPREMPASWNAAAVQAQAIAARSYGRNAQENNSGRPYDICDTTQCQVYGGMTHYDASGNVLWSDDPAALTGNAGSVLQYGGKTIFAQFSASNGGWTVAGGEPYLVAKQDPYDNAASGDPYLNWTRTVSVSGIASYYGLTTVRDIVITQRDGNGQWGGRVLSGVVDGANAQGAQSISTSGFALQDAMNLPHNWFTILATNQMPMGHIDRIDVSSLRTFTVWGWSFDPNHPDLPGKVALKVDGTIGAVQQTFESRPDVQKTFGLQTSMVGFALSTPAGPGSHTICLEAQDQDGGGFAEISCRTIVMPDQLGHADVISGGTGTYRVAGWALDPDHKDLPGEFQVIVDGTAGPVQTTPFMRTDVQQVFGTVTAQLGFDQTNAIAAGTHTVCVDSIDRDGLPAVPLRCETVTVS